jgi:hypothetical protein
VIVYPFSASTAGGDGSAPSRRGQPVYLLELAAQVTLVGEATLARHRRHRQPWREQLGGRGEPQPQVIGVRQQAELEMKRSNEMALGEPAHCSQDRRRDQLAEVGLEVLPHWGERPAAEGTSTAQWRAPREQTLE